MNSRERVSNSLAHKHPDKVPMSVGATSNDTFTKEALKRFTRYLNQPNHDENVINKICGAVETPLFIQEMYQSDFVTVRLKSPFNPSPESEIDESCFRDAFGVKLQATDYYYDAVERSLPGEISIRTIEQFPWPDGNDKALTQGLRDEVLKLKGTSDKVIVMDFMVWGPFEGALWMRGWEDFLCDLYTEPILAEALMEHITNYDLQVWNQMLDEVGDLVDIVCQGDDLGMQDRPLISLEIYQNMIKKHHRRIYDTVHKKSHAKILHHSCGSVYGLLADLVDVGVDILNPIQTTARDMEPKQLKRNFGKDLVFWGGLDIQKLLPFGTPSEIRNGVKELMEVLGEDGGYVFAPSHNIQPTVPVENIKAMFEAALEYR